MSESNVGKLPLIVIAVLFLGGLGYFILGANEGGLEELPQPEIIENTPVEQSVSESSSANHDNEHNHEVEVVESSEQTIVVSTDNKASVLDDGTPLPVRAIGDPNAPITLVEYSSLSCGHCAQFHKTTLTAIKEQYVDTGKVYMIFREFPLNRSAIDASKVLRCMPEDKYYSFMNLLFDTQDQWAFSGDYLNKLKQNAKLAGLSEEQIDTCLADTDIEEKLATSLKIGSEKYGVRSTPSFVVNAGERLISGNQRLSFFTKIFDDLLEAEGQ